jgi:hypothetical protein
MRRNRQLCLQKNLSTESGETDSDGSFTNKKAWCGLTGRTRLLHEKVRGG